MRDIHLIGCGKLKQAGPAAAADFYTGALFQKARAYAENRGGPWAVVSAKHGLILPGQIVQPYNLTIAELDRQQLAEWADNFNWQLTCWLESLGYTGRAKLRDGSHRPAVPRGLPLVALCGRPYVRAISMAAIVGSCELSEPLAGLGIGQRLQFFNRENAEYAKANN